MTGSGGSSPGSSNRFATTQWSLVIAAGDPGSTSARDALADLCGLYWSPIYFFLRRRGADEERARDLAQGFFAKLLEKNYVGDARRDRGRFRTFLLTSLKHYLANEWDRDRAQKRGGGASPLPIDGPGAEDHYRLEPSHEETPERLFHRRWARTLIDTSMERLRAESDDGGTRRRFDGLVPFLTGENEGGYREVAAALDMSESAARVAVHRMRRRFGTIVREEVARTVGEQGDVEDELRQLFAALDSGS